MSVPRLGVRLDPQPAFLIGREDLLAELDTRLANSSGTGPRTVVLSGLGGVGKTSVAVEYAYRHRDEVGVAWQFDCEDPATLPDQFGELADQLNVRDLLATRDWVATVKGVLAEYPPGWLLIFDNVENSGALRAFLPPAGPGRVLVTSRNALWSPGQAVNVSVLSIDVAADFLVTTTSDPDRQAASALAVELGGLPLALEQAAAYIRESVDSLAGYLALFRKRRAELLARGGPTGYDKTVASTWTLAFDRVRDTAGTVGILRLLAFCAPDAVPLRRLLQHPPGLVEQLGQDVTRMLVPLLGDPLVTSDAIRALRKYSLISPHDDRSVSVHRLVQAVTIDQMPKGLADRWRQAAAALIEAAMPEGSRQPQTWPVFRTLRPHADKALAAGSSGAEQIANYLGNSGSYAAARDLQHRVLAAREQTLDPAHPNVLTARRNLAHWMGQSGDPAGARDECWALLPVIAWARGAEHPDTLAVRADIANWTRKTRRRTDRGGKHPDTNAVRIGTPGETKAARGPGRAKDQYAKLLHDVKRLLGPEHLLTLEVRDGLAWSAGEAGNPVEARDQFAALLPVVKEVLGSEDPLTLHVRAGLARWTGSKRGVNNPVGARDQFVDLLPVHERVLGPEHPETLYIRHSVARWTGQAGDPAGARDKYEELLSVRERILGPDHPDTRIARKLLDHWTGEADSEAN
jgi:hypothetical protein